MNFQHSYIDLFYCVFTMIQTSHSVYAELSGSINIARIAQWVTCLTADACLIVDPGVRSHTFVEIDHEIISMVILLPLADSRRAVVSYKGKYVHKVMVNLMVKLAQEKSVVR